MSETATIHAEAASHFGDPDWCERQYNPRLSVAEAGTYAGRWTELAAATRARLPHEADLVYGDDPREIIDLFHAEAPKGCLIFIHGGYWRAFSKHEHSWVADALVPAGVTVAVINYPLCPQVSVDDIAEHCRKAIAKLWHTRLSAAEKAKLVVAGHSAGGYLTAAMFATDWTDYGLPASPFAGGVPISGVFELEPLVNTSMNAAIRFTEHNARAWSLHDKAPLVQAPLILTVGALESTEFHRQSEQLAEVWHPIAGEPVDVAGCHHFNVVEQLREPGTPVYQAVIGLIER